MLISKPPTSQSDSTKSTNSTTTLVKSGMVVGLIQGVGKGLLLLITIILARLLSPEDMGLYSYYLSLAIICVLPLLAGFQNLFLKELSRYLERQDYGKVKALWLFSLKILVLLTLLIFATYTGVKSWFFEENEQNYILLAIASTWASGLLFAVSYALRGYGSVMHSQSGDFIYRPTLIILGCLACFYYSGELTLLYALYATLFGVLMALLANTWVLWSRVNLYWQGELDTNEQRSWVSLLLVFSLASGVGLMEINIGRVLVKPFVEEADIAFLHVAITCSTLICFPLHSINQIIVGRFSALYAQGNMEELQKLVRQSAGLIFFGSTVLVILGLILGEWALVFVFGEAYRAAYPLFVILLIAQWVSSACGSAGSLMYMTGLERLALYLLCGCFMIHIVLLIGLIPVYGITGAAVVGGFSLILSNIIAAILVRKHLGIQSVFFLGARR